MRDTIKESIIHSHFNRSDNYSARVTSFTIELGTGEVTKTEEHYLVKMNGRAQTKYHTQTNLPERPKSAKRWLRLQCWM